MKSMKTAVFMSFLLAMLAKELQCLDINQEGTCDSPQFVELGKNATINCSFHENFFSVLWYDTTDTLLAQPILHYRSSIKTGLGYVTGEYDVHPNGSLIIKDVSLTHEKTFSVAYLHSQEGTVVYVDVVIFVIVKPSVPYPVFEGCSQTTNRCFAVIDKSSNVTCSVTGARPMLSLTLISRTAKGDKMISNQSLASPVGKTYTSRIRSRYIFQHTSHLILLVCKACSPQRVLENTESLLLAQHSEVNLPSFRISRFVERYERMELTCTDQNTGFTVWRKAINESRFETLLYSAFIGEKWSNVFAEGIVLGGKGSLVRPLTNVKDEGLYYCIFGDGESDSVVVYDISVVVYPVPMHPVIKGCEHKQYCLLEVEQEGNLTCTMTGIRPLVHLEWRTLYDRDAVFLSFQKQQLTVKDKEEIFDVTVTATYSVKDSSPGRITLECRVVGARGNFSNLRKNMDLIILKDKLNPTITIKTSSAHKKLWTLPGVLFVLIAVSAFFARRYLGKQEKPDLQLTATDRDENAATVLPLLSGAKSISGIKDQFLKEIKGKYQDLCYAVQPIPYIKDRLYCVNNVFIEGEIEVLHKEQEIYKRDMWTKLGTYQNALSNLKEKSKRIILEGEPGYGKSTVALQFAFDWCNQSPKSALEHVDILILLRLRQLGGVHSIYRAIKDFILPSQTSLNEEDITDILDNSKSVLVILDGFDEYPNQDNETNTDIIKIIAGEMFKDFMVITTTRSSFLPKEYPPLTTRIRLNGFDEEARIKYLRKAVISDDDGSVGKIQERLNENPILSDLCQIPLHFVIFAHIIYERKILWQVNSVTSFFRFMISCFFSHMRNKMEGENVRKYNFERDHSNLDLVAFEGLVGDWKRIVWRRDALKSKIGLRLYDQYVRIGILVEEELIDFRDAPVLSTANSGSHIVQQYNKEVRFFHKLFCEWYAAHHLADYIQQNPNSDLTLYLKHLNPFDVQYLYRFACGLNSESAEDVINYLSDIEGGKKFAILCLLEQNGMTDNIKERIRQLCFEGVIISSFDSLLLQRSSLQLLELASRNNISIEHLDIDYLESVDVSKFTIRNKSGLVITSNLPFRRLVITLYDRKITEDEVIDIFKFSAHCSSLLELKFDCCLPDSLVKVNANILRGLTTRNVKVKYQGSRYELPMYILNLHTGRWMRESDDLVCTVEQFKQMNSEWIEKFYKTEEYLKGRVQITREMLREDALKRSRTTPSVYDKPNHCRGDEDSPEAAPMLAIRANDGNTKLRESAPDGVI
ncbi:NLR family CARD domain-containing protein 4 [Holothuria leucospilota]|uniref:NLR family CARD domain-containing protein 4 n=1 Tax=Holothuria leucospilota TaxID=206669 RepID=A0A9Q1CS10_HOLLE|nr:NLR family CARD domain-containing protein 4 [Holothuria leucospilota]